MHHRPAPLRSELRLAVEPLRLLRAAPQLRHTPRGQARVMVLPGYRTSDRATLPLRRWLSHLGHRVHGWGLGVNQGRLSAVLPDLEARIADIGPPVALVGWSWGGVIARALARSVPKRISRVATLGSPLQGGVGSTVFGVHSSEATRRESAISAAERESAPLPVPALSVYTRRDAVVAWTASRDPVEGRTRHVEVDSCHLGLGVNPVVWRILGEWLAEAG